MDNKVLNPRNGYKYERIWCRSCNAATKYERLGADLICTDCHAIHCTFHGPIATADDVKAFLEKKNMRLPVMHCDCDYGCLNLIHHGHQCRANCEALAPGTDLKSRTEKEDQMSDTPRTDDIDAVADQNYGADIYQLILDHARQLERELLACQAERDTALTKMREAINRADWFSGQCDSMTRIRDEDKKCIEKATAECDAAVKALGNCYVMARRELQRLKRLPSVDAVVIERWEHVKRFCEETGLRPQILRATLPTEITDGSDDAAIKEGEKQ